MNAKELLNCLSELSKTTNLEKMEVLKKKDVNLTEVINCGDKLVLVFSDTTLGDLDEYINFTGRTPEEIKQGVLETILAARPAFLEMYRIENEEEEEEE